MNVDHLNNAIDLMLHSSHATSRPDEATARFLHDAIGGICGFNVNRWPADVGDINSMIWAYRNVLRQPPVIWGVGDAFKTVADAHIRTTFVLPTNTKLATTARVVLQARKVFGDSPFDELVNHGKAGLGTAIETNAGTFGAKGRICHLVCREPANPAILSLPLPERTCVPTHYIFPLFGKEDELPLWVNALTQFRGSKDIQETRPASAIVMVLLEQKGLGLTLERQLIRRGLLVGRDDTFGLDYPDDDIVTGYTHETSLARFVSPGGPLTPAIYANWTNSGIDMPSKAWKCHERVMREEG